MPVDAQGRTVSEDGLWYWDGQQWRAVEAPPLHAGAIGHQQPQVQVVYHMAPRTNGLAITSAITGILSYFVCPFIGAVVAVVTGHAARRQIRRLNEGGWGWATAGLVLGYAQFAIWGLILVLLFSVCGGLAALGTLTTPHSSPWPAPAAGMTCDQLEHTQVHYHVALQIVHEGLLAPLPDNIGIHGDPASPTCYYWLHVHAANKDVIHIESPVARAFTLGDFFTVWSVWEKSIGGLNEPLDPMHVSSFTLTAREKLVVFVDANDGTAPTIFTADPKTIVLKAHEVITLEITSGTTTPPPPFDWSSAANTGL